MQYNLASLRKQVVVDRLDDEEFEPDVVDNFINHAQRDIFNQYELPFQEKIFEGQIPAGATMFKLPDDVAQVQSFTMSEVSGFINRRIPFRDFFQRYPDAVNSPASKPGIWTQYAGNILLSAPTDKEYTMTLYYIKKPKELLEDTDTPDIPSEFSELLVLGAFMRIQRRNEDFDLARETEAEYSNKMLQLVNRYGVRDTATVFKLPNQQIRG